MSVPRKALVSRLAGNITQIGLALVLLLSSLILGPSSRVAASSHREAPLIARDPFADTTDVYARQRHHHRFVDPL